jgi:hypothetical protein
VNVSQLRLRCEKFDNDDDDNNLVLLTVQIKALFFFATSGTTQPATQRHIPEDVETAAALL